MLRLLPVPCKQFLILVSLSAILTASCTPKAEKVSSRTGVTSEKAKTTDTDTDKSNDFLISAPKTGRIGTSFLISWETVSGAVNYDLILGRDEVCEDVVFKLEYLDKTNQSVTLTQPGNYFICVISRDSKGVLTEAVNIGLPLTILGEELQAGTFASTSSISATGFTLNWNTASTGDSSGANSLEYFVCSGASASAIDTVSKCEASTSEMAYTANTLTLTISGKSPSTTYYYNVVVKDSANNKALYEAKSQTTLADTDAPTAASFAASTSVGSAGFTLNWGAAADNVTTATSLQYFVCSGPSAAAINSVAGCEAATSEMAYTANTLTLAISGKSPATTHYYIVVVRDAAGNKSIYDAKTQATSSDATVPTAGSFSASTGVGATGFTLNWSAASDNVTAASSLEYFVCSGVSAAAINSVAGCEAATSEMAYTANTTTLAISGKAPSTSYYYNVVVRDAANNKSLYNGITQATTADTTVPTAGTFSASTSVGATGFTLN